jgi:hypothetical protein
MNDARDCRRGGREERVEALAAAAAERNKSAAVYSAHKLGAQYECNRPRCTYRQ